MKILSITKFSSLVLAISLGSLAFASKKSVNTSAAKATWFGDKIGGAHWGSIKVKSGSLQVDKSGNVTGGNFSVDMESISVDDIKDKETNAKLVGHLRSPDFFSVDAKDKKDKKFSTATFTIKSATPWGSVDKKKKTKLLEALKEANKREGTSIKFDAPTHLISGQLTIKGQSHSQDVVANVSTNKGGVVKAKGRMVVDRTRWNIRYGSDKFFDNLGNRVISDDFEVAIDLTAK